MEHDTPHGIVIVDCATHASCVTDDAVPCYCRYAAAVAFIISFFG